MTNQQFKCSACKGVFEKGRTDDDAKKEKDELFGDTPLDDCCLVCEDCFVKMMSAG